MATKRKDSNRIVLKKGEYQRTNGTYAYRWTDGKVSDTKFTQEI